MTVVTSEKIPPAWGTIIYLAIIHFVALFAIFPRNFSWGALGVAFVLYVITAGVGITLGGSTGSDRYTYFSTGTRIRSGGAISV